jgi:hypothetical protein
MPFPFNKNNNKHLGERGGTLVKRKENMRVKI